MSTINDSDLLLVERNGNLHQITYDQMSTLNDDDILLVERGGVQYKVEAQYVSTGPNGIILPSVEVLTPLNGAGLNDGQSYTPMSSAFVTEDTSPIYYRWWNESMTVISGGAVSDPNNLFDGNTTSSATIAADPAAVSQAVYNNLPSGALAGGREGETVVYAYAAGGGTIEVLDDDGTTVLRSYALPTNNDSTAIGIVRANDKIRFTTTSVNTDLYLSHISIAGGDHQDFVIEVNNVPRKAFEFTDDTDLDKMVAPIIQTDANGNVKVPTTSTVDSTTTIAGQSLIKEENWTGSGSNFVINNPPLGDRMVWGKVNGSGSGFISDNVALYSKYLLTAETATEQAYFGPELDETSSSYPAGNTYSNVTNGSNWICEIGVAPKVLDIVTWSGNNSSFREISHNLGTKPGMIIVKCVSSSRAWRVWHKDTEGNNSYLSLNTNDPYFESDTVFPSEPTKDAFYVGGSHEVNVNGWTYVAYVFAAETAGKIKCGSYPGNNSWNLINVGFAPGFILIKESGDYRDWVATHDLMRYQKNYYKPSKHQGFSGGSGDSFYGDSNNIYIENGRIDYNSSGRHYIYLAIAKDLTGPESTQLNLLSGQDLEYFTQGTQITSNSSASGSNISFGSVTYGGNSGVQNIAVPVDGNTEWFDISPGGGNKWLTWIKTYTGGYHHHLFDSERDNNKYLITTSSNDEGYSTSNYVEPYSNGGFRPGPGSSVNRSGENIISWNFLAAPQFFDVQKYVGTGSGTNKVISHDLGVEPGCIIVKGLKNDYNWAVYHSELAEGQYLFLNGNSAPSLSIGSFFVGADENTFTVGDSALTSAVNKDFISYIFAKDTPYVKCGKYVGSGSGTSVNVGFKPRWVMIKNISEAFDWMILDKNIPSNKTLSPNTTSQSVALANGYQFTSNGFSFGGSDLETNHSTYEYVYIAIADESEGHPPNPPSSTTVTETPDPATAQMVVNAESFDVGATASAPALEASITQIAGADGNRLIVDASTGTWMPGLYAKGTETTINAPGPDEITFTSQNQGTPAFSGVDATLASRTWTLESGTTATGPWTVVDSYVDYDVLNSQDGATPWSSNKPNLTPNTFYRVKVQYNSTNAESVESVYNTFKTGDA